MSAEGLTMKCKFTAAPFGEILPLGANAKFLDIQLDGLTGNYQQSGYPFDTPMWNGGMGVVRSAPIIHNDDETPSPSQDAWWPYEQSAYLLDGILKTAILTGKKAGIELFEENLFFLIRHPDPDGVLGNGYHCDIHWPMAVFFRGAMAYAEYSGNVEVKAAFIRHYQALSAGKIGTGFRHINNLEGLLHAYRWSGDETLLAKAERAYEIHNCFYRENPEGLRELYRDKLEFMDRTILHGVTFAEGIKLPVMLYIFTGKTAYLESAERALAAVLERHGTLTGLPSANEFFSGKDPLQGYESCLIHDFTWALGYFLQATGKVEYADRMEKIIYNALGGAVTEDFTSLMYISSPNQVIAAPEANHAFFYRGSEDVMQFRPDHSAQCCPGNIHHALPDFIAMQFMYQSDGTPAAWLYGASCWHGKYRGKEFTITETTGYPHDEKICFAIDSSIPMPLALRIPCWCENAALLLNGKKLDMPLVPGSFVRIDKVENGDEITLFLPMQAVEKHDRFWCWFEAGALIFSLPVKYREVFESKDRFAPRAYLPVEMWNYSPVAASAELIREIGSFKMNISASKITGFDALDQGRYTPQVPLYGKRISPPEKLTLLPYAQAKLRITAFPDGKERQPLFIYQALCAGIFPYDENIALDEQLAADIPLEKMVEIFPEKDGYYDLLHHFGRADKVCSAVAIRFWSDAAGKAVFIVGADSAGVCYVNGAKCLDILPGAEGVFTIGAQFESVVKKGFNTLLVKVGKGTLFEQYRNAWGVRADIFME